LALGQFTELILDGVERLGHSGILGWERRSRRRGAEGVSARQELAPRPPEAEEKADQRKRREESIAPPLKDIGH
jgi:hypothetical protein